MLQSCWKKNSTVGCTQSGPARTQQSFQEPPSLAPIVMERSGSFAVFCHFSKWKCCKSTFLGTVARARAHTQTAQVDLTSADCYCWRRVCGHDQNPFSCCPPGVPPGYLVMMLFQQFGFGFCCVFPCRSAAVRSEPSAGCRDLHCDFPIHSSDGWRKWERQQSARAARDSLHKTSLLCRHRKYVWNCKIGLHFNPLHYAGCDNLPVFAKAPHTKQQQQQQYRHYFVDAGKKDDCVRNKKEQEDTDQNAQKKTPILTTERRKFRIPNGSTAIPRQHSR